MFELPGLFVCLGGLIKFFSALGDRKNWWFAILQGEIITQSDSMEIISV